MKRYRATLRITISLCAMLLAMLLFGEVIGLFPRQQDTAAERRVSLTETVAVDQMLLLNSGTPDAVSASLRSAVERNPDVLSAALRDGTDSLRYVVGEHPTHTEEAGHFEESGELIAVPIHAEGDPLRLEMRYKAFQKSWIPGGPEPIFTKYALFVLVLSGVAFQLVLQRTLKHLDPSRVVPDRVRNALDTLNEGLVLLDTRERIALANRSLATTMQTTPELLIGMSVYDLPWRASGDATGDAAFPWRETTQNKVPQTDGRIEMATSGGRRRVFRVNSSPVLGDNGDYRGTLASFDDVTVLEEKKEEMLELLASLQQSREELSVQNVELNYLATRDPLTSCLNRRTFFELFERHWSERSDSRPLSCVMVDIDHFKSVNDNFGHATGDDVLRGVSKMLIDTAREGDVVSRYGGEEFCILFPNTPIEEAEQVTESIRLAIAAQVFGQLQITASLGLSTHLLGAEDPQGLLDEADKCLYVAKRGGRNQTVRWDKVAETAEVDQREDSGLKPSEFGQQETAIPFPAVSALISTLGYRDPATAAHSLRVADLAFALARKYMATSEAYIVEIAGLLHDIGKIGVPDSILLKRGELTSGEWQVMRMHDRIGAEIVKSSFQSDALVTIISQYQAKFGGSDKTLRMPSGKDIPLGARILMIADSYDAMTTVRPYRQALSKKQAIAELRANAGTQFDPDLVDDFIDILADHVESSANAAKVSRQAALRIGLQIESIADAVDRRDSESLIGLAANLAGVAQRCEAKQVQTLAEELCELAKEEPDYEALIRATDGLLSVCRANNHAYLNDAYLNDAYLNDA
jgi:diguanylate cyclase (GGDEF)-like protein/putative nucleotidyltransferase with HDIG domain/PAS domain S-box-containing protein